jgi:phosphohistidine phosphatase
MRKLILLRHGESADTQHGQSDFERVLTNRGIVSIEQLAAHLANEKLIPDYVLASPAMRTKQTALILLNVWSLIIEPHFDSDIYNGDDLVYRNLINAFTSDWKCLLLVGHNPSISALVGRLTQKTFVGLHPGQAAVVEFEITESSLVKLIGPF